MKFIPTVAEYMTKNPITVRSDMPITQVEKLMAEHAIRHLPVLEGGQLIGIVSQRDLHLLQSFDDIDSQKTSVIEACSDEVFTVSPKAPLDEVCKEMAQHRYGSVLVVENKKLLGIFTWVDALFAMSECLHVSEKSA